MKYMKRDIDCEINRNKEFNKMRWLAVTGSKT